MDNIDDFLFTPSTDRIMDEIAALHPHGLAYELSAVQRAILDAELPRVLSGYFNRLQSSEF